MKAAPVIALVHHHLRPGGVTRVLRNAAEALLARGVRVAVIAGESPPGDAAWPCPVGLAEGWGYASNGRVADAQDRVKALREAARKALGRDPDVWHLHNHALGKNPSTTAAVARMAAEGDALVLQIHDFAEDGRPGLYAGLLKAFEKDIPPLYPAGPRIQYATLNARDREILREAGVHDASVRVLPNPISIPAGANVPDFRKCGTAGEAAWIYPTRAIRRKNLGEWLLWSAVAGPGRRFQVTLAPRNPEHRPVYDAWVAWAVARDLPVAFEVGASGAPFDELLRRARAAGTVSVGEGFGLAFLEPYALGVGVTGRNLPEITADFAEAGIRLDHLYNALRVPEAWLDVDALRGRLNDALQATWAAYGRTPSRDALDELWHAMSSPEGIDFGRLDEVEQRRVIQRLLDHPGERSRLNPEGLPEADDPARIESNRQAIRQAFNLDRYADRLLALYEAAMLGRPREPSRLDSASILRAFLSPARFNILRS